MNKVIITAAITGSIHTPSMSPFLPITPDEIVSETINAYEAGASAAHIHVRDPKTGYPSADIELFKEVATRIKERCEIILTVTTGGGKGQTPEERLAVIPTLKPEMATFGCGSINFGLFPMLDRYKEFKFDWEKSFLETSEEYVSMCNFKHLKTFAQVFKENRTKPEFEIYDVGMLYNLAYLVTKGFVTEPLYIQFVLGFLGGLPPTSENVLLVYNVAKSLFKDFNFSVCAAGKAQISMCVQSFLLGGNARVGLEDNLFLGKGVLSKSNAEQVAKIIRIARELGLEPATPSEARSILGLKGIDQVNF